MTAMHHSGAFTRMFALPFGAFSDGLVAGCGVVPDDAVDVVHFGAFEIMDTLHFSKQSYT